VKSRAIEWEVQVLDDNDVLAGRGGRSGPTQMGRQILASADRGVAIVDGSGILE